MKKVLSFVLSVCIILSAIVSIPVTGLATEVKEIFDGRTYYDYSLEYLTGEIETLPKEKASAVMAATTVASARFGEKLSIADIYANTDTSSYISGGSITDIKDYIEALNGYGNQALVYSEIDNDINVIISELDNGNQVIVKVKGETSFSTGEYGQEYLVLVGYDSTGKIVTINPNKRTTFFRSYAEAAIEDALESSAEKNISITGVDVYISDAPASSARKKVNSHQYIDYYVQYKDNSTLTDVLPFEKASGLLSALTVYGAYISRYFDISDIYSNIDMTQYITETDGEKELNLREFMSALSEYSQNKFGKTANYEVIPNNIKTVRSVIENGNGVVANVRGNTFAVGGVGYAVILAGSEEEKACILTPNHKTLPFNDYSYSVVKASLIDEEESPYTIAFSDYASEEGTCGENATYSFNAPTGALTISGTGEMDAGSNLPWVSKYKNLVKYVIINDGITSVSAEAFLRCSNLKSITISESVTSIGNCAFDGCTGLTSLTIMNSECEIYDSADTISSSAKIIGYRNSTAQTYAQTYSRTFVEISTGSCGENATYSFDSSTGTLTIIGTGAIADYGEGETPFYNNENITSIIINDGITRIGNNAFYCCKGVLNIRFCDSIKSIGSRAFYKCQKIESITLPEGLLSIGSSAFSYCESLKSIDYPSTVTIIEESTFFHCTELEDVVLTSYIESIGDMAFHFCSNLKSIIIPNKDCVIYDSEFTIGNTATIYSYANSTAQSYAEKYNRNFSLICSDGTKEHTYVQSVKSYDDSQIVYEYVCSKCSDSYEETVNHYETGSCGDNANYQYDRLTKTLDITGTGALYNYSTESERPFAAFASEVKTLNIGKKISVEETDWSDTKPYYALAGFTSVENLTISCSACVFEIDLTNAEVDPNDFSMDIDIERMPAIKSVKNLTLTGSEANSTVGRYLFNNYENLETVTLDGEVSAIEIGAFANCPELKSFTVLNDSCSLQKVFEYTIYGDGGVETNKHVYAVASPTVRAHANSLAKDYATEKGLTFVALCTDNTENHNFADGEQYCLNGCGAENPDYSDPYSGSCGTDASYTFDPETGTLTISGTGEMYPRDDLPWTSQYKNLVKSVIINDGITTISDNAFLECVNLTSITMPDSLTSIGGYAFSGCTGLTNVTIPNGVTFIGVSAFKDCTNLISIIIPNSVTIIGNWAFMNCRSLNNITLPDSLTSISEAVFEGCKGLINITIPSSITSIGHCAFQICRSLTSVNIPDSVTSIDSYAFYDCTNLTSITISNPDCDIYDSLETISDSAIIYGYANSTARAYADKYNRAFVAICTDGTTNHKFSARSAECLNGCGAENPDFDSTRNGTCGENAKWHYDNATKTLYVYGSGAMDDSAQPWSQFIGNIEYVVIEEGIENIGADAFTSCTKLQSVSIPNTVTAVGENAFKNCSALRSITIPETVTSIGGGAFDGCTSLISVNFTGNSAEWNSLIQETSQELNNSAVFCSDKQIVNEDKFTIQNDTVYSADKTVLVKIVEGKTLEEYEVPSTVEEVTEGAFEYLNADLIIFDKNVKKLGPKIFGNDPEFLPSEVYEYPEEIETMLNTYYTGGNEEEVLSGGEVIHNSPKRLSGIVTLSNTFAVRPQSGKVITYYCLYSTKKGSCYMSHVANKHQTLAVAQPSSQTFTGSKIQPALKVYNAKTNSLVNNGTAYRVTYGDNFNAGYGHAYIKGIGSFGNPANASGGYSVEFKINKRTANSNTVWLSQSSYNYNGRVQKPSVKGVSASYFTAYYPTNGNIGVKTVKIVFKGNYTGTVSKTYTILPKKTKLSKLKRGTKSIIVKWKKQKKQVDGYQIQYSTNKSFKGAKTENVKGAKKTSYTVKKLKSKKKYYVRVQTFKKVGGKFYFSGWSKAKSVKVK